MRGAAHPPNSSRRGKAAQDQSWWNEHADEMGQHRASCANLEAGGRGPVNDAPTRSG